MRKWMSIVISVVIIFVVIVVVWFLLIRNGTVFGPKLPTTSTSSEKIPEKVNSESAEQVQISKENLPPPPSASLFGSREIEVTNGVKHSVPLNEILGGGPEKDGIPSIDNPSFVSIEDADFISDNEPGIAVSKNGIDRFYPFQILVWHEIVNDTFGDDRVLVTYCPLCFSGIVFDPLVEGERVEFGTSGKLWQSNLVMYDRKTDTYWSQVLGEAIRGKLTGESLNVLPSDMTQFGVWKESHPHGEVLSKDTGVNRLYGYDPYGSQGYYTDNKQIIVPVRHTDDRLDNKTLILGIVIDGKAKAYDPAVIKEAGEIVDEFAGITVVARYVEEVDAVRLFERSSAGRLTRLNPFPNYWFSWVAAHPETEVLK